MKVFRSFLVNKDDIRASDILWRGVLGGGGGGGQRSPWSWTAVSPSHKLKKSSTILESNLHMLTVFDFIVQTVFPSFFICKMTVIEYRK